MSESSKIINIGNSAVSVSVDLYGGAIVNFTLAGNKLNPLAFKYPPELMPENNQYGSAYKGHFVCIGRWGEPSEGEKRSGMPNHGQAANLLWTEQANLVQDKIIMHVEMPLEGLWVRREINLDDNSAVFKVTEQIKNINPLGRLYNVVQHPAFEKPFLTDNTVVNCNAGEGFNYVLSANPLAYTSPWPVGITQDLRKINLSKPNKPYNSLFSFIVKNDEQYGWLTAFSPENNLLIGYLWKRDDYPWLSFWQDYDGDRIRYRGLEFGTTGMHKPYKQIIDEGNHRVMGEESYKYIDAGETQTRAYIAFTATTPEGFTGVSDLTFAKGQITLAGEGDGPGITIGTTIQL